MLSLVICLLHFFFFPNALLGAAVYSQQWPFAVGTGALLRRSSTQYNAAFGLLKRSCSPVWFDARLDWWLVWPFSGLARALPTVLHTSFYIVCHFLLFQLHSAEAIEAVYLARLVLAWRPLAPLQPRRVKRELLSLACKKAAVAPTAAVAAPPAFFFFWRETLYIPSH